MELKIKNYETIRTIVEDIARNGGRALVVGGAVRDMIMGVVIKDIDIEVYGLLEEQLEKILAHYGPINTVGKSFGVLRLAGLDVDWSLPRADSPGRKPTVVIDPYMTIENAARRRDLTMNAISFDMITHELIDPWHGVNDIKNKILRTPDARFFIQDPLRLYRVMQFIGRFEMVPDAELNDLCAKMDISAVSRERIEEECKKLLLRSRRPSLGIRWLHSIGRLHDIMPELADTVGVAQEPKWHPEGDVFEHSMQAFDAAAFIAQSYDNDFDRLLLLYAALCHDLGKVATTTCVNGVIKSIGHEKESKRLARIMLKRITHNADLIDGVASLVLHHMAPLQFIHNKAKMAAYKRLACKLGAQVNMKMLIDLCRADKRGRNATGHDPLATDFPDVHEFENKVMQADVMYRPIEPLLKGADIMDLVPPGPRMGQILKDAYVFQIENNIVNKQDMREYIAKKCKS